VTDNGIGIAPEMLHNIFIMFTQVDQSLERTHAGLGVGLALSRHLVELHGGQLSVASNGIGQGSTFAVRLQAHAATGAEVGTVTEPATSGEICRKILLVDDNVDYVTT